MSVPKRRQTSSRRDRRRKHNDVLNFSHTVKCSRCGSQALPHRACPDCGTYKGKQVVPEKK
ncbi:MAG: 50S ribosomal protein L32 [Candidatus Moranbacteria bacterium]|nr:50S ribosomal protein L32 [Candidatus Moranbacteria bacterium]